MKMMMAQMWQALSMFFQAWEALMQIVLNICNAGKHMSGGLERGAAHDAEVDDLKLQEEIAVFKQQAANRRQALLAAPAVTPAP